VDLLVGSPDCTHFSVAKGSAPRDSGRRALADVFVRWAEAIRPRVIILENVREFLTWGPLDTDGQPDRARAGESYRAWVAALEALGYRVEHRLLRACDYGAPTSRLRLFVIARCDGRPIRWPAPTHGGPGQPPHRTAAEVIDWSIPCPSIFGRARPLAESTLRRIAAGVHRYVLTAAKPFLLCLTHGGRLEPVDEPLRTITTAHRGERALVAAFLAKHYTGATGSKMMSPIGTVTTQDHHSLVAAHMTHFYGTSQAGRALDQPLSTVTSGGQHAGLVASFLTKYYGSGGGQDVDRPLDTITCQDRFGLVTVQIDGETYVLTDIGLRMLSPRELARAQGFPDSYVLQGTKADQVAAIGNSVVPQVMAALVSANLGATP
jgi:DNA (cytosine-5)-methyltransferase 1